MRSVDGVPCITALLDSRNEMVLSRVVGALHNLSTDLLLVEDIYKSGAIPSLVNMLRYGSFSPRPNMNVLYMGA